jgi:hypothetical protein
MVASPSPQNIENNVIQVVKGLIEDGKYLDSLPELGMYAHLCELLLEFMPSAPDRATRNEMLKGLRRMPANKPFDDLLKRGFDPQPEKKRPSQHPQEETTDRASFPQLEFGILDPSLAKDASPWLDEFIKFSRKWSPRSPDIHHIGVGLWLQSTISLGRVAAVDGGVILPSLYIQLIAPSSVWAKTTVARNGRGVLKALDLEWMVPVDRASPEKFLSSMSGTIPKNYGDLMQSQQEEIRKEIAMSGKRSWYYSEFRGMLKDISQERGRNAEFKEILLQMADGERYRIDTHSRGREEIARPYLALLATMTPDCMKIYEKRGMSALWTDGFYPRMLFACTLFEIKKTKQDLKMQRRPNETVFYPESLLAPLRQVHQDLGMPDCAITEVLDEEGKGMGTYRAERAEYQIKRMYMTVEAKEALDDYGDALLLAVQDEQYVQVQAWYARLRDKCLQIATSFGLLQNSSKIELKHIARSQQLCELFRESLHKLVAYLNDVNVVAKVSPEQKILDLLVQKGPLTARDIRHYTNSDSIDTQKRLDALVREGEIISSKEGKKTVYCIIHEEDDQVE